MTATDSERKDVAAHFPISSQTSLRDKAFILGAQAMVRAARGQYAYLEIGSFLGGSLVPFLACAQCVSVLSVDERGRQQPDERGATFDYAGITSQTMIDTLHSHGVDTAKLETHDGSIDTVAARATKFDLAFIDGEHTDEACFRDFLWAMPLMREDSVVMFHDSTLVHRAIKLIAIYLRSIGKAHAVFKGRKTEMTAILFGAYAAAADPEAYLGPREALADFYREAEAGLLKAQVRNRVRIGFDRRKIIGIKVNPPKVRKAY